MKRSLGPVEKHSGWNSSTLALSVFGILVIVSGVALALHWGVRKADSHGQQVDSAEESTNSNDFAMELRLGTFQARSRRLVYPYSVIPGGINSADELRAAAAHDPVIGAHYSGFDYHRARMVEVKTARAVYVSYRRNGKIFWTHKQATLYPGEKLLTDGRTSARTRCGNQVSTLPQVNTSPFEPAVAELDRPDAVASGMTQVLPGNVDADLFPFDPLLPLGPLSAGGRFMGGPQAGAFVPYPLGGGFVGPTRLSKPPSGGTGGSGTGAPGGGSPGGGGPGGGGPGGGGSPGGGGGGPGGAPGGGGGGGCVGSSCNPPNTPPPAVAPEPGTAALVISGIAAIVARLRNRRR